MLSQRNPRVDTSRFAMIPKNDVPRSTFRTQHTHKTTFDAGYLIPFYLDEVLPGDVHKGDVTMFARLATPLFPIMDAMTMETFFFFVPARLLWANWKKFQGEQANPGDSISYVIPTTTSPVNGYAVGTVFDYFGLPLQGQVTTAMQVTHNVLPLRAYNLIWNEWFRDENLQNSVAPANTGDGPDSYTAFALLRRNKKHDYFTSALPWPLKGGVDVTLPLQGTANVLGIAQQSSSTFTSGGSGTALQTGSVTAGGWLGFYSTGTIVQASTNTAGSAPKIYADLSTATGATINQLRQSFAIQKLLERDARGGTRYTEMLHDRWGVTPQDSRLQRPEYIGGGRMSIQTQAIPQTSATGLTGGTSALGSLGAAATGTAQHQFSLYAAEHGYLLGIVHATAEVTYQQGLHRMWTRSTRYDFYMPEFAHLGEQAIRNDEIYVTGTANDTATFGYQERWAEYRQMPSRISGLFRSTSTGTIDPWHLAAKFTATPVLNSSFIQDTPPLSRALAAGTQANGMQVLLDALFTVTRTRAMPMYSVPGMMDRF